VHEHNTPYDLLPRQVYDHRLEHERQETGIDARFLKFPGPAVPHMPCAKALQADRLSAAACAQDRDHASCLTPALLMNCMA
jgi:hypothetical protein